MLSEKYGKFWPMVLSQEIKFLLIELIQIILFITDQLFETWVLQVRATVGYLLKGKG